MSDALSDAGRADSAYLRKAIVYAESLLATFRDLDPLIAQNTRRSMAEAHFTLGETECGSLWAMPRAKGKQQGPCSVNEDASSRKQERLDNMLTVGALSGLVILMAVGVILFLCDKAARQAAAVPPPVRRVEQPVRRPENVAPAPRPVVTVAEPVTNSSPPRVVEPPPAEVVTILPASNEDPLVVTPEPSVQIVVTNVVPATAEAEPPDEIEAKGISSEAASSGIANAMSDVVAAETREKLVTLSREVFSRKNDPRFAGNSNLMRVANAVAAFNLHYPTREESREMVTLCHVLLQTNCVADVATAIEGSMYLFENEIIMMDLGYARYGRIWVNSREMAAIQARLAEREKKIAEYIESQNTKAERSAESASTRPVRAVRIVSVDKVGTLLKNTRKIRRIGHSLESKTLKRPSNYIRTIGDSITGTNIMYHGENTPVKRIGGSLRHRHRDPIGVGP